MPLVRVAAAALNQTPFAWESNLQNIVAAIDDAREAGAAVLCLPELAISGYGCEDMFCSEGIPETSLEMLAAVVGKTQSIAVCVGLPLEVDGALYNAAAVCVDGRLLGFACKQYLAGDGIHYEPRWFTPWSRDRVEQVEVAGERVSAGDLLFEFGPVRVGVEICRDAWKPDRPGRRFVGRGANLLLNPSASHFAFGKHEVRRSIAREAAVDLGVPFVYSNLLGNESGRAIFDGGSMIAAGGEIVGSERLSMAERVLTVADIEVVEHSARNEGVVESTNWRPPERVAAPPTLVASGWDVSPASKYEEFSRAVPLALLDYLRKSRAGGFVVSLSGGADSSAVAVLVWLMVRLGVNELGLVGLKQKLAHIESIGAATDPDELVGRLLRCVYQATRNSSETTENAARQVAEAVGTEFLCWGVDPFVDGYVETVAKAVGRPLSWEADDLALQNIQARARGPGAWLLANLTGSLLLATSNRSEAAVGYATMDGDTCGGLSPIAGIDKAFLREWLRWMETTGPTGIGPLPALAAVNSQQPTAELRPADAGQTDEADLMPYDVLDAIERAAIRDKLMPLAVFERTCNEFPAHTRPQVAAWVERFFRLWCRNQWKRERYAPSFHLDDENLDPKTWCRFPILSGGFDRELEQLSLMIANGEDMAG
ncbi:MAG: NAD(+) synthase [Planctomycetota bacterium]